MSAFVSSGGHLVAAIKMVGSYSAADHITSGISGTVAITDPMVVNGGGVQPAPAQTFPRHGIDLPGIAFGAQKTLAYAENNADAGGTLTVTDGRHAAAIAFLGNYMATSFVTAADGHGGTLTHGGDANGEPVGAVDHAAHGMNVSLPSWLAAPMPSA